MTSREVCLCICLLSVSFGVEMSSWLELDQCKLQLVNLLNHNQLCNVYGTVFVGCIVCLSGLS